MSQFNYKLYYQRKLPHYQPPDATLFITFRLAGSLPREVLDRLGKELSSIEAELSKISDLQAAKNAKDRAQKILFGKWDTELDYCYPGPKWLGEPDIAELVCEALHYRDGKQYALEAYSVMPNHVHLVCSPLMQEEWPYSNYLDWIEARNGVLKDCEFIKNHFPEPAISYRLFVDDLQDEMRAKNEIAKYIWD
jgi:hypothetical protein